MESKLIESQQLFARNIACLIQYIFNNGFEITLGEAWRTPEQQKIYVQNGRSKTMESKHLKRLAIDFNFFKNDVLIDDGKVLYDIGKFWESLHQNNKYGGFWRTIKDYPHFEMEPLN